MRTRRLLRTNYCCIWCSRGADRLHGRRWVLLPGKICHTRLHQLCTSTFLVVNTHVGTCSDCPPLTVTLTLCLAEQSTLSFRAFGFVQPRWTVSAGEEELTYILYLHLNTSKNSESVWRDGSFAVAGPRLCNNSSTCLRRSDTELAEF